MNQSTPIHRVLFLCELNRSRSATAERLFCKRPDLHVCSAGTSEDALVRVNQRMLEWADAIFIMDPAQRRALDRMFPGHPALERLICLDISDDFAFLQPGEAARRADQPAFARRLKHSSSGALLKPGSATAPAGCPVNKFARAA